MGKILVTGITGNVGREVAEALKKRDAPMVCAVRDIEKAQKQFQGEYTFVPLDFVNQDTYDQALEGVDRVFLNYPPEMPFDDFHAFIFRAKERGVRHLTYLSVKDVQFCPLFHTIRMKRPLLGQAFRSHFYVQATLLRI